MFRERRIWYSPRVRQEMDIGIYGHWGPPGLVFPTAEGDARELEREGAILAVADLLEAGRAKLFCLSVNHRQSFGNRDAHPGHRSWMQRQYDEYVRQEVVPFVRHHCQTPDIPIWTAGFGLGAYHAVNTLLKHPGVVKRCFAHSGVYDMKRYMDGHYDDNLYFNNPVDYAANLSDPDIRRHLASCEIRLITGTGPWESSGDTYRFSEVLAGRGIEHQVDDWGLSGGHGWVYWKPQFRAYLSRE